MTDATDGATQATLVSGDVRAGTGEYNTPMEFFAPISRAVGVFDVDVCASADSDLADTNIRESGGLAADWMRYDTIWCNHPYAAGEPDKWLQTAKRVARRDPSKTIVTLSKADPSTEWWRAHVTDATVLWFPKRIEFVGESSGADFPNVLAVFGTVPDALRHHIERETGWVTEP